MFPRKQLPLGARLYEQIGRLQTDEGASAKPRPDRRREASAQAAAAPERRQSSSRGAPGIGRPKR